jgi:hypothetical protein
MSQFVFPPLTANLDSEASNGGSLPSKQIIIGGYDGANVRAVKVDSSGELQVDVGAITPGTGATSLGKAIQSAQGTTDTGVAALVVRNDTLADLSGADGDYAPLQVNATGALYTEVKTSALPSGAATEAKQDVIETTLTAIETDADTIAGAVSGTEMQVDVVASLPAGSNNIGDVDVLSVIPGVGATNLGKAIQSAQGATDTGIAALVVRNDTLADLAGADHDYAPLQVNASGALYVEVKTSGLPSGAATEAKQDVIETTLNSIEGDTSSLAGAVSGTEMQVDIVASLPAGSNNIGDVDVLSLPALPAGTNTIGKVDVNAIAPVDFLDSGLVNTGTANIASTGTTVVSSLAAACTEIEIQEDIGEFMSMRVGGTVKAYLPLGGGRVKVSLAATDAVQLYSETGTAISSGKIAINFLG